MFSWPRLAAHPYIAAYLYAANQPSVYTDPSGQSIDDVLRNIWALSGLVRGVSLDAINDVRLGMGASSIDQSA